MGPSAGSVHPDVKSGMQRTQVPVAPELVCWHTSPGRQDTMGTTAATLSMRDIDMSSTAARRGCSSHALLPSIVARRRVHLPSALCCCAVDERQAGPHRPGGAPEVVGD